MLVSNIDAGAHTADFVCDVCGDAQAGINVNTDANVTYHQNAQAEDVAVKVVCWNGSCGAVSTFMLTGGGPMAQALVAAKTE